MIPHEVTQAVQACFPDRADLDVQFAGAGDSCNAISVDGQWIFLFARHEHASRCLERLARITPSLAGRAPLAMPAVQHHGTLHDRAFVGYRAVQGRPLGELREVLGDAHARGHLVSDLAAYLTHLHTFDVKHAIAQAVPSSRYAFPMREREWLEGNASDLYARDLDALRASDAAGSETLAFLERALRQHLDRLATDTTEPVLLHGEISPDHVLLDPATRRVTGIIDLNGMYVGRAARDFLYLYEELGPDVTRELLSAYGRLGVHETVEELHFLYAWHTVLRLLWAVERGETDLAQRRLRELGMLKVIPANALGHLSSARRPGRPSTA